jgi:hypothetical protein
MSCRHELVPGHNPLWDLRQILSDQGNLLEIQCINVLGFRIVRLGYTALPDVVLWFVGTWYFEGKYHNGDMPHASSVQYPE